MFENLLWFEICSTLFFVLLCFFAMKLVESAKHLDTDKELNNKEMAGIEVVIVYAEYLSDYKKLLDEYCLVSERRKISEGHEIVMDRAFFYRDNRWGPRGFKSMHTAILFLEPEPNSKRYRDAVCGGYTVITIEDLFNAGIFVEGDR